MVEQKQDLEDAQSKRDVHAGTALQVAQGDADALLAFPAGLLDGGNDLWSIGCDWGEHETNLEWRDGRDGAEHVEHVHHGVWKHEYNYGSRQHHGEGAQ